MATSSKTEWSVGFFILMGFACAFVLAFASTNSKDGLSGDSYNVIARFTNAGELKPRAPVRIAGVKVGEVASVVLDPVTFDAIATLRISASAGELPSDTAAAIYTSGLLGDRYVGLAPGGFAESLKEGDEILLTQPAVVLEQLIGQFMFGNGGADEKSDSAPSATE
ncbi:outer membrane lipid asymmetry maintenance protein MlaD [Aquimonas sp.]|jgi:phospholipid/cholesterol/gamma-HCH transport system substrate-binding protein|uniref:outer membrane lipid asymmetry maintenance protein MlaD n=1 Tax=Aquimonas sp. TaxID=1872588 RepID=UPI0037BE9AEB